MMEGVDFVNSDHECTFGTASSGVWVLALQQRIENRAVLLISSPRKNVTEVELRIGSDGYAVCDGHVSEGTSKLVIIPATPAVNEFKVMEILRANAAVIASWRQQSYWSSVLATEVNAKGLVISTTSPLDIPSSLFIFESDGSSRIINAQICKGRAGARR